MIIKFFYKLFFFALIIISMFIIISIGYLDSDITNTLICEVTEDLLTYENSTIFLPARLENTMFYDIESLGSNTWKVLFKNVDKWYTVNSTDTADPYIKSFNFRECECEVPGIIINDLVSQEYQGGSISEVVAVHYNNIQRGAFHSECPNIINPNAQGRNIRSPLDQFEIRNFFMIFAPILGNFRISLTNMGFYLTISTYITLTMSFLATNYNKIMAHYWSISQESIYATVHSIVINQINNKTGQRYYPFIYSLFILILISNLIGMIPYCFASTSHFILAFFLSFTIVLGSTILGFLLHKLYFFSLFVPSGCPLGLLYLLVLIEFISYLARNVSLGLRLAANILSGHMLLNILSEFTYKIMKTNLIQFFTTIIPILFIIAFTALELGIAFIQSQVFVVLSCSYIRDALFLH